MILICWELGCQIMHRGCLCFSLPVCGGEVVCGSLAYQSLPTHGGVKVRKGGVRVGWSVWLGVEQESGSPSPALSPAPGAWGLVLRGGSHQLRLNLKAVRMTGGSRAKSGFPKTWWKKGGGAGRREGPLLLTSLPLPCPRLPNPLTNYLVACLLSALLPDPG